MNQTMAKHVVTIEDPIEYLHRDRKSVINQREVGLDTTSFKRALRRVLRQDPDVILIGEMRDEETVQTALSAAETGHLVLSTVHTVDATESINRMLDFFPPHQHQQARAMIAGTLKGVVSQRLIPSADGGGRVAVCEILVMTGRVRDMIMDPTQTGRLHEVIQEGEYYGMQTFDQALLGHLQAGRITMEEAVKASTHPHDFKLLVAAEGRRSTSMADLVPRPGTDEEPAAAPTPQNGNGNGHEPAPVTPLAPVAPEGEPQEPAPDDPDPPPPPSPAASNEGPAQSGSVPPPGAA
jgi:twitching motility protein PilT